MIQDLRYAMRMLLKHKGITMVTVLTLALGIGANTAIFSVINALLLRPLPYRAPEQLVKVFQSKPDPSKGLISSLWSYPRFEILRDQNESFGAVAGFSQNAFNLTGTDSPERVQVEMVSASYFSLLGVNPIAGRTFDDEEDRTPATNLVALLGYGLWQRRFGGDAQVIGQSIELDTHSFTVVGILPAGFAGQSGTADLWVTTGAAPTMRYRQILANANSYWFQVLARLKSGVSLTQAQAQMMRLTELIEQKYPSPKDRIAANANIPVLEPLQSAKVEPGLRASLIILLIAVGLVLLIACANVASLLLARGVARRREFAVRAALGAGRWRLVRQLITESLLLALLGGLLGLLIGRWGLELIKNFRPADTSPFWSSYARAFDFFTIDLDWRVLSFNFALALLTGLLFGLLPAFQSSLINVHDVLKQDAGGGSFVFRKLSARSLLVVGEIALSMVLLIGAGLMIRSLSRLQAVDLGFSNENVLTMTAVSRNPKAGFYEQLLARVQALPEVEAASFGNTAPLLGYNGSTVIDIEGRADLKEAGVGLLSVSADYFKTLGIPVRRGRAFTAQDRIGAPRVALINEAAARSLFPEEDPIGKRVRPYSTPQYETTEQSVEIVGVVADVHYGPVEKPVDPDLYLSFLQPTDQSQTLIVRTTENAAAVAAAIRDEVMALDRNVPLTAVQTMRERSMDVTARARFITVLLGLFAGLAMLLSAIGIYGVIAYSVSARTREMGIRIALGAQTTDVLGLVLREGATLISSGLALGLIAALVSLRVLQSQLYNTTASDPFTLGIVTILLGGVALLACYLPARKATRTDPMRALRYE